MSKTPKIEEYKAMAAMMSDEYQKGFADGEQNIQAALQSENARLRAELERVKGDADDRQRLDFIQREYIRVDSFDIPTGAGDADVGWRLTDFYMAEPHERIVAEVFRDDLRAAIDAARGKG